MGFGIAIAGVRHCQRTAATATRATAPLDERIGDFQVQVQRRDTSSVRPLDPSLRGYRVPLRCPGVRAGLPSSAMAQLMTARNASKRDLFADAFSLSWISACLADRRLRGVQKVVRLEAQRFCLVRVVLS